MPKWPNNAMKNCCEVVLIEGVKHGEIILYQSFQERKEVWPDLWEGVEVGGD